MVALPHSMVEAQLRAEVEGALLRAGGLSTLVAGGLLVEAVSEAGGVAGGLMVGVLPISSHLVLLVTVRNWQCCGRTSWCPWELCICNKGMPL